MAAWCQGLPGDVSPSVGSAVQMERVSGNLVRLIVPKLGGEASL